MINYDNLKLFKNNIHFTGRISNKSNERQMIRSYLRCANDWPVIKHGTLYRSRMLIYSMSNSHCQIQNELLFACLAEFGGSKVFVVSKPLGQRYWKAMGFPSDRFIPWQKYEQRFRQAALKETEIVVRSQKSFDDLKEYMFNGISVGKHVLSAAGRKLFRATFDTNDEKVKVILKNKLYKTIVNSLITKALLDDYKIDQILMNEPNYASIGISHTALMYNKCYIQYIQPYDENAYILKRYFRNNCAVNPISLSSESWNQLKKRPFTKEMEASIETTMEEKYSGRNFLSRRIGLDLPELSQETLIKRIGLDQNRKTAVVFSHVLWDANMFWGEDLIKGGAEEWLIQTVRFAMDNKNMNWIIKIHPANVWKMESSGVDIAYNDVEALKEEFGVLPDNFHIILPEDNINPRSLFQITDVGFTIRGTVGMELPILGIPVVTAGTGRYSGHGFTIDPSDIVSYKKIINEIHEVKKLSREDRELAARFFYSIFSERVWRSNLFKADYRNVDPKTHRIYLRSWQYLSVRDRKLAEFLATPEEEDYLYL